jgi:hypothetical protein
VDDPQHFHAFWLYPIDETVSPNDYFPHGGVSVLRYHPATLGKSSERACRRDQLAGYRRRVELGIKEDVLDDQFEVCGSQKRTKLLLGPSRHPPLNLFLADKSSLVNVAQPRGDCLANVNPVLDVF